MKEGDGWMKGCWWRVAGYMEGSESVTLLGARLGGERENKDRDGEIDGSWTGVCGFQCVQSVVVFPPTV